MTTERETQTQAVPANTIAKDVLDVILSGEETPEKRSFLDS